MIPNKTLLCKNFWRLCPKTSYMMSKKNPLWYTYRDVNKIYVLLGIKTHLLIEFITEECFYKHRKEAKIPKDKQK